MLFTLKLIGANSLKKALFYGAIYSTASGVHTNKFQKVPSIKCLCCMSRNKSTCWNYFLTWHGPDMLMLYTQSYCNYIYRYREWVGSRNRRKQLVEPRATPLEERRRVFFSNLVQTIHAGYMYTEDDKFEPIWAFANLQKNSALNMSCENAPLKIKFPWRHQLYQLVFFVNPYNIPKFRIP